MSTTLVYYVNRVAHAAQDTGATAEVQVTPGFPAALNIVVTRGGQYVTSVGFSHTAVASDFGSVRDLYDEEIAAAVRCIWGDA